MNERIRELAEQAELKYYNWSTNESNVADGDFKYPRLEDYQKFAELIITECLNQCYFRGMNDELYAGQLRAAAYIEQHFGVEESKGWVCPKCGTDRTKAVCPQGPSAAVDGRCPMVISAQ